MLHVCISEGIIGRVMSFLLTQFLVYASLGGVVDGSNRACHVLVHIIVCMGTCKGAWKT